MPTLATISTSILFLIDRCRSSFFCPGTLLRRGSVSVVLADATYGCGGLGSFVMGCGFRASCAIARWRSTRQLFIIIFACGRDPYFRGRSGAVSLINKYGDCHLVLNFSSVIWMAKGYKGCTFPVPYVLPRMGSAWDVAEWSRRNPAYSNVPVC